MKGQFVNNHPAYVLDHKNGNVAVVIYSSESGGGKSLIYQFLRQ